MAVEIEARDIRELFRKLEAEYPGLKPHIERGIAVSINGTIYRDTWSQKIPADTEIYLFPAYWRVVVIAAASLFGLALGWRDIRSNCPQCI